MKRGRSNIKSKYSGKSFAEASSSIDKKYKDRDTNPISQRAFMMEMDQLIKLQEASRIREMAFERIKDNKNPSSTKKMAGGGVLDPDPTLPLNPLMAMAKAIVGTNENPNPAFASFLGKQFGNTSPGNANSMLFNAAEKMAPSGPAIPVSENISWGAPNTPFKAPGPVTDPPNPVLPRFNSNIVDAPKGDSLAGLPTPLMQRKPVTSLAGPEKISVNQPTPRIKAGQDAGMDFLKNNIYAPVALGKALEFVGKGAMMIGGYDKVKPVNNPYESEIKTVMQGRGINMDQARQDVIAGQNAISQTPVRSQAVKEALIQDAYGKGLDQLGQISSQVQGMNNQYKGDYASTLGALGQQRVQAENYAEQLNNQSKVGHQMGLQAMLESIGGAGQQVTNLRAGTAQQKMLAEVLRTKNFQMGDAGEILAKAQKGEELTLNDFIKLAGPDDGGKMYQQFRTGMLGKTKG